MDDAVFSSGLWWTSTTWILGPCWLNIGSVLAKWWPSASWMLGHCWPNAGSVQPECWGAGSVLAIPHKYSTSHPAKLVSNNRCFIQKTINIKMFNLSQFKQDGTSILDKVCSSHGAKVHSNQTSRRVRFLPMCPVCLFSTIWYSSEWERKWATSTWNNRYPNTVTIQINVVGSTHTPFNRRMRNGWKCL